MREVNINTIRSVDRAIDILDVFISEKSSVTIDEICSTVKLPKATVYRLLYTLERRGLVNFESETKRYTLGLKILEYSGVLNLSLDVRNVADRYLRELQLKTQQTILMAIPDGDTIVYVYKRENPDGLKFSSSTGQRRPLHYGVLGRVILAYSSKEIQERVLNEGIPQFTKYTQTDSDLIQEQLDNIRIQKFHIEKEETNIGVTGIASPIFNRENKCIAVIGVLGPSVQLTEFKLEEIKQLILDTTKRISSEMGCKSY